MIRHRVARVGAAITGLLMVLWAALVWFFQVRGHFTLLHNDEFALGVFSALFGRYTFSLANLPLLELLQSFVALGLTQAFGLMVLRALAVRLPDPWQWALAFPVGFGLSGIAFELLTMAGWLNPAGVWIVWALLLAPLGVFLCRSPARPRRTPGGCWMPGFPSSASAAAWWAMVVLTALITLATFWHAVFFPETYWDSLILYLGYARMTYLEGAFPFKAEAQVGIGLGANYPHLYSTFGAVAAAMFGHWTDLPLRLAAPVAGLASCGLVYMAVSLVWRDSFAAAGAMLLFRAVPNGIIYSTYASDYAFAILFMAGFMAAAALYIRRPDWRLLALMTAFPATAMHLNYLMGILWVPWGVLVLLAGMNGRQRWEWRGAIERLRNRTVWLVFIAGILLASPWYIRNTVLTGNPVYAFFPEIFTASVRINPEVLESAKLEWFRHGRGIGWVTEEVISLERGEAHNVFAVDFERRATLAARLRASWLFWVGYDIGQFRSEEHSGLRFGQWGARLAHLLRIWRMDQVVPDQRIGGDQVVILWPLAYRMAPFMPGFVFPGMLVAAVLVGASVTSGNRRARARAALLAGGLVLAGGLLAYMYLLADFYLYQIVGIVGPGAVLSAALFRLGGMSRRVVRAGLVTVLLAQGLFPGLGMALMNFKFTGAQVVEGQLFRQTALDAFRNPGIDPALFHRMRFGRDPDMWDFVNRELKGERLLTHDNRHYVYDPSIKLVHLDDWDMQQGYDLATAEEIAAFLRERGIGHYLRIAKEDNHTINRRLGMARLLEEGWLELLYEAGENRLYRIREAPVTP